MTAAHITSASTLNTAMLATSVVNVSSLPSCGSCSRKPIATDTPTKVSGRVRSPAASPTHRRIAVFGLVTRLARSGRYPGSWPSIRSSRSFTRVSRQVRIATQAGHGLKSCIARLSALPSSQARFEKIQLQIARWNAPRALLLAIALDSLKIRPGLRVFFIADSTHSLQIVSAAKWSRCDDSNRHCTPDPRHGHQFFFCRGVDIDAAERSLLLWVRAIRFGCARRHN